MKIIVSNPDDQHAVPIFEGEHTDAFNHLPAGQYTAWDEEDDTIWQLLVTDTGADIALKVTGYSCPVEPNWGPLEQIMPATDDGCGWFMFMGTLTVAGPNGKPLFIQQYKHRETRTYLNLDDQQRAYRVRFHPTTETDGFAILMDLEAAKEEATS